MKLNDKEFFLKTKGIYKITNKINNKCYIGSAVNLKLRLQRHFYELNKKLHSNKYLQKSFDKYGIDNFWIEILEEFKEIDYEELLKIEKHYIIHFDSINKGYNLMLDNSSFLKELNRNEIHILNNKKRSSKKVCAINIETNEKEYCFNSVTEAANFFNTSTSNISRVCKNRLNHMKGYVFCYLEEYDKNKDYRRNKKSLLGRKCSEIHKQRVRETLIKNRGVVVIKYDQNFNFIEEYPSITEAERLNNIKKDNLKAYLKNKKLYLGFYWRKKEI